MPTLRGHLIANRQDLTVWIDQECKLRFLRDPFSLSRNCAQAVC